MPSGEHTVRQDIIEALKTGPMTAREVSKAVHASEKEVRAHLAHVARSITGMRASGHRIALVVEPSGCLSCGFVFKKRGRLATPSRCPICKSEEITETRYSIEEG